MIKLVLNITTGYEALSGARLTISPNKETPDENGPTSTTTNKVMYITCKTSGLVVCIIDHYPLGNQRTEMPRGYKLINQSKRLQKKSSTLSFMQNLCVLHH